MFPKLKEWYETKYRMQLLFTIILVVLALVQIGVQYSVTGDFVHRGVSLKGGSTITINSPSVPADLESFLHDKFPQADLGLRTLTSAGKVVGIAIDADTQDSGEIDTLIKAIKEKMPLDKAQYSIEIIGSSLGESFFRQTLTALAVAFVLMGIVVFIYFRSIAPSMAVIAAALSDMIVTLAVFNLTGLKLSTAGVAAFLMLIGYSVDTDILLSTRVLKRTDGTVNERVYSSIKTGLTMSATTLAAVIVALIFVQSDVIRQIMFILLIGLLVDPIMTWIQNVAILRIYLEKKHGRH